MDKIEKPETGSRVRELISYDDLSEFLKDLLNELLGMGVRTP
jgi:hypothetical protein